MRALLVGGSGWLGGATARVLADEGWDVVSLSRGGGAIAGEGIQGDVRLPGLGLEPRAARELADGVTHVLSCFGSVDWELGPRGAVDLHVNGTRNVLRFAESCPRLERFVHVSSVLALGRAQGRVGNRELALGQGFRNWYEYAKHVSEAEVRARDTLPRRIVRVGGVLGESDGAGPSPKQGLLASLPYLLRGYPAYLEDRGTFPVYVGDVHVCAAVLARALTEEAAGLTWTWFDRRLPSLAEVLTALCSPWNVVPRIVDLPALRHFERRLGPRLGLPRPLLEYTRRWMDIDPRVLDALPEGLPEPRPGYIERTTEVLKASIGEPLAVL